jgi:hypothetical protein
LEAAQRGECNVEDAQQEEQGKVSGKDSRGEELVSLEQTALGESGVGLLVIIADLEVLAAAEFVGISLRLLHGSWSHGDRRRGVNEVVFVRWKEGNDRVQE